MTHQYIVRTNDYLDKIAHNVGLDPDAIWNLPENAELRALRQDPDLLCAGDVLVLPEPDAALSRVLPGTINRYVGHAPETLIRLRFLAGDAPLAVKPYVVEGLGEELQGETDSEGHLEFPIPVGLDEVNIRFPNESLSYRVLIGALADVATETGQRQRLANLGYLAPGWVGELRQAIETFQCENMEPPASGVCDPKTQEALVRVHGR